MDNYNNFDPLRGYRDPTRALLEKFQVSVWSEVRIETEKGVFSGLILPRANSGDENHLVLKLDNGYNVGIHVSKIKSVEEIGKRNMEPKASEPPPKKNLNLPKVTLLGTGGTIASKLDYKTGGVIPAFTPDELYQTVPELAEIANLSTKQIYSIFSENVTPQVWLGLAEEIKKAIEAGAEGIVIAHGTDTMHYTASALSFMCQDSPIPIVMVGSARSADRPSSDAALNLIGATYTAAHSDIAEILVCMFGPTSEQYDLLHRGTRVRKMHTSYRSAFRTISDVPMGTVRMGNVTMIEQNYRRRDPQRKLKYNAVFNERVTILYYYPDMKPDIIDSLVEKGYQGIVIAGTGLGHVNKPVYPAIKRAIDAGVHIYMTAETLWGYVQMYVYETGREIMQLGVISAENMLTETAYVKLGWVLGQTTDREEVKKLMLTPISGELTLREPIDGYLIMQGGLPEVKEFIMKHRR